MTTPMKSTVTKMRSAMRTFGTRWTTVDPAVALGMFGTGVGLAVPVALPPRD